MKKILLMLILLVLATSTVAAQYRYVPVTSFKPDDIFADKYATYNMQNVVPPPPSTLVGEDGRLYYYRPYPLGPITQKSYYKVEDMPDMTLIKEGSWEDGYNKGYFEGYNDGEHFSRYGYEGYRDYLDAFMARTDPDRVERGTYQLSTKRVQLNVKPVVTPYDEGFRKGVVDGFNDGYYDRQYSGVNPETYALEVMQDMYPGTYEPMMQYTYRSFRSFPNYLSGMGSVYYGFNY